MANARGWASVVTLAIVGGASTTVVWMFVERPATTSDDKTAELVAEIDQW